MSAPARIVFARRQSPDWARLAADYRAGRPIDPARFVPENAVQGFPDDIEALIAAWNASYRIDFFTIRAFIAARSAENIAAVPGASSYSYQDEAAIAALAGAHPIWLFFHDDDDFFADFLPARVLALPPAKADTLVFPLIRVHQDLATFVPPGLDVEFSWGRSQTFLYRYHSNNYAISSKLCTPEHLRRLREHISGSEYADAAGFTDCALPFPVSATVKTPCSASMLPAILSDRPRFARQMSAFIDRFSAPDLLPAYAWLAKPLREIAMLFAAACH